MCGLDYFFWSSNIHINSVENRVYQSIYAAVSCHLGKTTVSIFVYTVFFVYAYVYKHMFPIQLACTARTAFQAPFVSPQ